MAITECGNGHVYDTDQYTACPYCNSGRTVIDFLGSDSGKTVAPEGISGGHTVRPADTATRGTPGGAEGIIRPQEEAEHIGQTVAPDEWRKRSADAGKTVGVFKKKYNFDPVTGWLVCIEGPEKGNDFRVKARINTVGRGEEMDICLKGDLMISRENHASVAYDPRHNDFRLVPGNSVNTVYINDEPVYVPTKLQPYDCIEMGECKLLFVPFCCDKFSWSSDENQDS